MKRNSKTIIPYEDIDYELVELIKCINEIDGIETTECCCGHGTGPCQIWLKADSIEDVTDFIHNYLYCNPLWRIVVSLTDTEIDNNEWNNPTYLLETTCSDYFYTGVSIDNLKYRMNEKRRELILCKDCIHFEYDSVAQVDGIPLIVAHEICKKWGEGCKTNENGYCFLAERRERTMAKTCANCIYKYRKWGDIPCRTCMESGSNIHENWTGIDEEEVESKEENNGRE